MQFSDEFFEKLKSVEFGEDVNWANIGYDDECDGEYSGEYWDVHIYMDGGFSVMYKEDWGRLSLNFDSCLSGHQLSSRCGEFKWGNVIDHAYRNVVRRSVEYSRDGFKHCETGPAYEVYHDIFGEAELIFSHYFLNGELMNRDLWENKMLMKLYW